MIKSTELRIGNWVLLNTWDTELKPHRMTEINEGDTCVDLQPIVLTPEILEKAGFKIGKDDDDSFHMYHKDGYINIETDWSIMVSGKPDDYGWASESHVCQYVHQLQNLIFALTGEELTINL